VKSDGQFHRQTCIDDTAAVALHLELVPIDFDSDFGVGDGYSGERSPTTDVFPNLVCPRIGIDIQNSCEDSNRGGCPVAAKGHDRG
jgi:hypothetical protein